MDHVTLAAITSAIIPLSYSQVVASDLMSGYCVINLRVSGVQINFPEQTNVSFYDKTRRNKGKDFSMKREIFVIEFHLNISITSC